MRYRSVLVIVLTASLLLSPAGAAAPNGVDDGARRVTLGGITVRLDPGTRQCRHRPPHQWVRGHRAAVAPTQRPLGVPPHHPRRAHRLWRAGGGEQPPPGHWHHTAGDPPLTETFGNAARPAGSAMPFHRVRRGDYWVQDNASRFYNELRNQRQGGFRWWLGTGDPNASERLADYRHQYVWSVVIDFNRPDPVRQRGSGIFLHVNGAGATAGCVSTPKRFVRAVRSRLDPRLDPVIAIGR